MIDKNKVENIRFRLRYNLHFFDESDKTEQATSRKKEKSRSEGQVAKSQEVSTAFLFLGCFFALKTFGPMMFENMLSVFNFSFNMIQNYDTLITEFSIMKIISFMFGQILLISLPMFAVAAIIGIISNLIQVGWHPTSKALKVKFSKLNPIKGFKKIFSMKAIVELVKALAKFAVIIYAVYSMIKKEVAQIILIPQMGLMEAVAFFGGLVVKLGLNIGVLFMFIAVGDFAYTKFKHAKDLRMSKHEVKQEYKETEGDPQIKGKIRQKMREASMRRMMQDVPNADVIITNPTHYAVAIKYDKEKFGDAPVVIAKGVDFLAKRIKDAASENDVEIVENVQLARALYATVDIGKQIPPELFQAVAEVLAFVYKLKNKDGQYSKD